MPFSRVTLLTIEGDIKCLIMHNLEALAIYNNVAAIVCDNWK